MTSQPSKRGSNLSVIYHVCTSILELNQGPYVMYHVCTNLKCLALNVYVPDSKQTGTWLDTTLRRLTL